MSALEATVKHFSDNEDRIVSMENVMADLVDKIDDLENRSRRNNLVIFGVPETDDETAESLHGAVVNRLFCDTFGLPVVTTERVHRLGRRTDGKTRPVMVKFLHFSEKMSVLRNCPKLKGSTISISEDFSLRVRNIRKRLWDSAIENRKKGDKVTLIYNKLKINNTLYVWDAEKQTRIALSQPKPSRQI